MLINGSESRKVTYAAAPYEMYINRSKCTKNFILLKQSSSSGDGGKITEKNKRYLFWLQCVSLSPSISTNEWDRKRNENCACRVCHRITQTGEADEEKKRQNQFAQIHNSFSQPNLLWIKLNDFRMKRAMQFYDSFCLHYKACSFVHIQHEKLSVSF